MKHLGPTSKKILLLLQAGIALSLTRRPDQYFRILRTVSREWSKINERYLRVAIKQLYQSKLVGCKENKDGIVELTLSEEGRNKILKYDIDKMEIKKPKQWDKLWRLVVFDVPEDKRQGRRALAAKLKDLGFHPMQKSVFIHPYECKDEIDFIAELFNLVPYVRFLRVRDVDIELDLRDKFRLL